MHHSVTRCRITLAGIVGVVWSPVSAVPYLIFCSFRLSWDGGAGKAGRTPFPVIRARPTVAAS
jgi:hypothetical protein